MKFINTIVSLAFILGMAEAADVYANGGVCVKCQIIREEREKNPEKVYESYEDYLMEEGLNKDLTPVSEGKKT